MQAALNRTVVSVLMKALQWPAVIDDETRFELRGEAIASNKWCYVTHKPVMHYCQQTRAHPAKIIINEDRSKWWIMIGRWHVVCYVCIDLLFLFWSKRIPHLVVTDLWNEGWRFFGQVFFLDRWPLHKYVHRLHKNEREWSIAMIIRGSNKEPLSEMSR